MLRHTAACKSSTNYVYDVGGKNLSDCSRVQEEPIKVLRQNEKYEFIARATDFPY